MLVSSIHRPSTPLPSLQACRRRRGSVAMTVLLVAALVLVVALALLEQHLMRRHRQLELQNAIDAAALAGAQALVNEFLLTQPPDGETSIALAARNAAQHYAFLNRVDGRPLKLQSNLQNYTDGELVLGRLNFADSKNFDAKLRPFFDLYRPDLNAVRIALRRNHAAASANAYVDHDVVGFQVNDSPFGPGLAPPGQHLPAIPMVPLAVLTDPCFFPGNTDQDRQNEFNCWQSSNKRSWEYQILAGKGQDRWQRNPTTGMPQAGSDGIREMRVVISDGSNKGNGQIVAFSGNTGPADTIRQVLYGVTYPDLQPTGGRLLLNTGAQTQNQLELLRAQLSTEQMGNLAQALSRIVGQRRVWMLYLQVQKDSSQNETVVVLGFVTARIMDVQQSSSGSGGKNDSSHITVTLQPSMLTTVTAVTNYKLRNQGPRTLFNPYVCKVRLVE